MYTSIDMYKTGCKIKECIKDAGYTVKDLQKYLHMSCPQPIYRWLNGKTLPSIDNLYAICILLGVHMEELIVPEYEYEYIMLELFIQSYLGNRMKSYYQKMYA